MTIDIMNINIHDVYDYYTILTPCNVVALLCYYDHDKATFKVKS